MVIKMAAAVCLLAMLGQAWANGLYIHPEPHDAEQCYLSNAQGQRLFEGQYQSDCFAILPNRALSDGDIPNGHAVLNMLSFQGRSNVVINSQGHIMYHAYWYDNGPDYIEEGLVRIQNEQGLIGYADGRTGAVVIVPQYVCASFFENGKATVALQGHLQKEADLDHQMCIPKQEWVIDKMGRRLR